MLPERLRNTSRRDKRLRCRAHLNWVKQFACVIPLCNSDSPIDPHHIHEGMPLGMGIKPPDDRCVSLCREHHDECHRIGEAAFFEKYDPLVMEHRKNTIVGLIDEFNAQSPALKKLAGQRNGVRPLPTSTFLRDSRKQTTPTPHPEGRTMIKEKRVALLVLDLDGTVRKGKDELRFVNSAADVEVFPEAVALMRAWKAKGGRIIAASNQGGISLGIVSIRDVAGAMAETHRQCDRMFDKIAFCQHHPDAKDPEYARCWCRKPSPGLAIEAALDLARATGEIYPPHMALFVGDRPEDEACAKALNMDFMWASDWRATAAVKH